MNPELKENILRRETWLRGLYMLLFVPISWLFRLTLAVVVVLQFGWALICRRNNQTLKEFGRSLSDYVYQIVQYLTFNSEEKPFPFAPWPRVDAAPRKEKTAQPGKPKTKTLSKKNFNEDIGDQPPPQ